jgi:Na+-driven multidrug efflux pump
LALGKQTKAEDAAPLSSGICQPVKVTRNATSVYLRSLNEVTVPVIVGLLATIFVFDPWLSATGKVTIIGAGLLFVLLSVLYRVQKATLA